MINIKRMSNLRWVTTVLALAILFVVTGNGAAQPGVAGLGNISVTSSLRPEFVVGSGETRTGRITVRNGGSEAATVSITPTDFVVEADGQIRYVDDQARSNRGWIEVAVQAVVPAGTQIDIPFTITVPADASLSGTYWSMLLVEPVDPAAVTEEAEGEAGVRTNVSVSFRYGISVLTHVGQPVDRELRFTNPQFSHAGEGFLVALTLENPTVHLLAVELWLELYDEQGNLVASVESRQARIYPESSRAERFELGTLQPGRYQAVVIADAGGEDIFGVRYTLPVTGDETDD